VILVAIQESPLQNIRLWSMSVGFRLQGITTTQGVFVTAQICKTATGNSRRNYSRFSSKLGVLVTDNAVLVAIDSEQGEDENQTLKYFASG
jgi:hypothetical protein